MLLPSALFTADSLRLVNKKICYKEIEGSNSCWLTLYNKKKKKHLVIGNNDKLKVVAHII